MTHQGSANGEHLLFPAAQGAGQLIAPFGQDRKELIDPLLGFPNLRSIMSK